MRLLAFTLLLAALSLAAAASQASTGRFLKAAVAPSSYRKATGKCVCIFDFDETLRVWKGNNGDSPAKDARGILDKCKEFGYEIAIASANCNGYKLRKVLPWVHEDVFTTEFFQSDAFQYCEPWKVYELRRILDHYETKPQCAMFFDDQYHNVQKHARAVGVSWRQVDGEVGVTWNDFWGLRSEMERRCDCT